MSTFATILLAAGDSRRMGHDKALLPFGDRTVVEELSERAVLAGASFVRICVAAHLVARIPRRAGRTRILVVPEDERARGPIASIRHGLATEFDEQERSLSQLVDAWLLWPVDHPFVHVGTLRALASARAAIRAPSHARRRGHPILLDEREREGLLAATKEEGTTLRDFLRARREVTSEVPVNDEAIHWNCDDSEQFRTGYARFVGR